jgi:integrase
MTPYKRKDDGPYYVKISVPGEGRVQRCLDSWDLAEAKKRARALTKQLRTASAGGRFEDAAAATKSRSSPCSSLAKVASVYARVARVKARTVQSNVHCMESLLRYAGVERGLEAPVNVLDKELVRKFQDAIVAGKEGAARNTAITNANSILRQARSLFSRALVEDGVYAAEGVTLPKLDSFRAARLFPEPSHRYVPITQEAAAKLWAAAPALKAAQPQVYLAFLFSACLGLRRSEGAGLRWSDVLEVGGKRVVRLEVTKNGEPRNVPVEDELWEEILAASKVVPATPSNAFILQGAFTVRWRETYDGLTAWLETMGWDRRKKAHELRKWAGARLADQFGTRIASMILGNTEEVFRDHYDGLLQLPAAKMFKAG